MKILGSKEFERALHLLPRGYSGDMYLLTTGAKLKIQHAHEPKRVHYAISGYFADGSDVLKILDRFGISSPIGVA